jgi:hypothetical protein
VNKNYGEAGGAVAANPFAVGAGAEERKKNGLTAIIFLGLPHLFPDHQEGLVARPPFPQGYPAR